MLKKLIIVNLTFWCVVLSGFSNQDDSEKKDYIKLGAAVRFNIAMESYERSNDALDFFAKFDTWYLAVDARLKGFDLSAQYRFYPESKAHFIHHAYIGYAVNDDFYTKLGVFQKPFGIDGAASHSWWFQAPYYLGLEDTYGTGIGASYQHEKFKFDLAYFRQAAPKGNISSKSEDNSVGNGRYSYAVVPTIGYHNGQELDANIRELDQFNARVRYQLNDYVELGLSGQLGSIYNKSRNSRKWAYAGAGHILADYKRWNFKGEVIGYNYKAQSDSGENLDIIQMAAYGTAYDVATRGMIYVAGLSYKIPINRKFIQSIEPYLDYSLVSKNKKSFHSTQQVVPGVMFTSGPILTYLDVALGRNHPALTSDYGVGLGNGSGDARWNCRVNLNIGYYF